jgi:adenylyl-sulfate kinase
MKLKRKVNILKVSYKTLLYRIIRILSNILLFGLLLGNWTKAISYNIWLTLLATIQYFVFDYFFSKKTSMVVKNKGAVVWFTGLSGSGKSTIADRVNEILLSYGYNVQRLDGDLGFSKEDRNKNIERVSFVAQKLSESRTITLASFISPYRKTRKQIRKQVRNFIEVYVNCPLEECEKRDVKVLYAKARKGEIKDFTGIDGPYEEPLNPEVICNTNTETIEQSANKVVSYLKKRKII